MPNVALVPRAATSIPVLVGIVDGFPTTTHRLETTVGGEPLEDGRQVTDHAVAREERLTLTGLVSDFRGSQKPADAWKAVRELHQTLTPLRVVTEWGVYKEMLIFRCEAVTKGRGLQFTLELHEVIRVGVTDLDLPSGALENPVAEAELAQSATLAETTQRDAAAATQAIDQAGGKLEGNAKAIASAQTAAEESRSAGDRVRGLRTTFRQVQDLREYPVAQARFDVERFRTSADRARQASQALQEAVRDGNITGAFDATDQAVQRTQRVFSNSTKLRASVDRTATQAAGVGRSGQVTRGRVAL